MTIGILPRVLLGAALLGAGGFAGKAALAAPIAYDYTGALQTFEVTVSGDYRISAFGAQGGAVTRTGGSFAGGLGAQAEGLVSLQAGDILNIVVGGAGAGGIYGGGGGGGSFVYLAAGLMPLVVAGGGGGAGYSFGGGSGQAGEAGADGTSRPRGTAGLGGTSGNGGGGGSFITLGAGDILLLAGARSGDGLVTIEFVRPGTTPVPEPRSIALLGAGLLALGAAGSLRRGRRRDPSGRAS